VSWLEVLAVIGIIGFVIYQQLAGQLLQGKRVVVLPAVVTVIGFVDLRGHHMGPADIAWLTVGAAGSLLIGLAFGLIMRLESRDGPAWGQMPLRGRCGSSSPTIRPASARAWFCCSTACPASTWSAPPPTASRRWN
jgi:hypothetical protein